VRILEEKVAELEEPPARVAAVDSQILQFRAEMQSGFSALRAANEETRAEMVRSDDETRAQMRVLHEEIIARLALLHEGRESPSRTRRPRRPRSNKKSRG
jgi:predicted phage gp36 major capsid-like protein